MEPAPDRQKVIRAATDAVNRVLSAQRFQVVVERVRKQVKVKGEKRSKWVDTDKFTFKLFEGATVPLSTEEGRTLAAALNSVVQRALAPWRNVLRERVGKAVYAPMTLSSAKSMQDNLHMIGVIDDTLYVAMLQSGEQSVVCVRAVEPVIMGGTDRDMSAIASDVNRGLAALMLPFQEQTNHDLQKAVDAVP